jgi:multidrug efflux pump subunit AcrA (membrane-fusion protein)
MKSSTKHSFRIKTPIVVLVFSACLILCTKGKQEADRSVTVVTPVQVVHPSFMDFTETVDLNANTFFLTKEIVRATFQGFIDKIYKNLGDEIKTNDLLFRIKTKELSTDDSLQIDLGDGLFKGSIAIQAKSNGVLTALNYNVGDFVSDGEQIAVVSNPSSLCIMLNVPFSTLSKINQNARCELFLPDGKTLKSVITKFIPSVDPVSQTQTVLLSLNSPVRLPENLNLNARLFLNTIKNAVGLPRSAVMSDETQDKFWVMKLVNDYTAIRLDIQKGIENDSLIQIASPRLNPNDQISSEGGYGLPDTANVSIGR